jgi:arylformamidase
MTHFSRLAGLLLFSLIVATTAHAKVLENIPYGDANKQKLDVYLPENSANSPIIFMVHGGAWRFGDKHNHKVVKAKVARWVNQGWIFISINYPMLPDSDPYQQAVDVAKALAYVQSHSPEWGGDTSKIIAMGHSAGAHLVSLVLTDPSLISISHGENLQGGILLDSAALDVSRLMSEDHPRLYDRAFGKNPNFWRKASAIEYLNSAVKPLLLVCSTLRSDSCPQAASFKQKAKNIGIEVQQLSVKLSHNQINATLGDDSRYTHDVETFIRNLDPRFSAFLTPAPFTKTPLPSTPLAPKP